MANIKRIVLYVIVGAFSILLANAWVKDHPPAPVTHVAKPASAALAQSVDKQAVANTDYVPGARTETSSSVPVVSHAPPVVKITHGVTNVIRVKTDVFSIDLSRRGGNIVSAHLLQYPISKAHSQPIQLLATDPDDFYVLQSGVTQLGGQQKKIIFNASQSEYTLKKAQDRLTVTLTGKQPNGLTVIKAYTFQRGDYTVTQNTSVKNAGRSVWQGQLYSQITRRKPYPSKHSVANSYNAASTSMPHVPYKKLTYKTMNQADLSAVHMGGWVAMQQHYFLTAVVPVNRTTKNHFYSHVLPHQVSDRPIYVVGMMTPLAKLSKGQSLSFATNLYVGPAVEHSLKALAPGLDHTVDYGFLWPVSDLIFTVMSFIYKFIQNWGWSIILTTILLKTLFFGLSNKSFKSMARMKDLQPKLKALQAKFADDRAALSQATMALYKKEKVNPLGGCLPMLIQAPVFIALFYVLRESVELRQSPFIFWIHDLSAKDPYYILPLIMMGSMFLQQSMTPSSADPAQAKMMWIIPVVFTVMFLSFPSGLVLYWIVNNLVQVLQQWMSMRYYDRKRLAYGKKR